MKLIAVSALVLGLSACSSEPPPPPPLTPTQQYLKDVHAALNGTGLVVNEQAMIEAGKLACNLIPEPGVTHSRIVAAAAKGLEGKGLADTYGVADSIVTAAERDLCPTIHYASNGTSA